LRALGSASLPDPHWFQFRCSKIDLAIMNAPFTLRLRPWAQLPTTHRHPRR
jgi:hypothetical protein